jgi:hypothetical protein
MVSRIRHPIERGLITELEGASCCVGESRRQRLGRQAHVAAGEHQGQ